MLGPYDRNGYDIEITSPIDFQIFATCGGAVSTVVSLSIMTRRLSQSDYVEFGSLSPRFLSEKL